MTNSENYYLVQYGVEEPVEGKWFIPAYCVIKDISEAKAIEKFEQTKDAKRKDRWKFAKVTATKINFYN